MESDEVVNSSYKSVEVGADSQSAVNSLILDYYKKFGRKRDLEQFFSLSTAQSDIKDPTSPFWRKMKNENDSSDSEGRKSASSREICRISIKCSVPESCSSQDEDQSKTKTESVSPPIIIEELPTNTSRHTDEESIKSDDNNSHRSFDALLLDTSTQKPFSPTSSVTSQRKLEWDSLADVGYGNETDRKTSASSLSTLERLALKQQYSNNDTKENIGPPTSHSTPLDENEKNKCKKGAGKKTTKIYKKDVDIVEVNVPSTSDVKPNQSINVNLTKHICFNVEKDGGVSIDNIKRDISVSPEKPPPVDVENINKAGDIKSDKEIQTSLIKTKEKSTTPVVSPKAFDANAQKIPIMISVNTLRKRLRKKKSKTIRRRMRPKKKLNINKDIPVQEKSGDPLSEAESFEYMPGHIYNQNHFKNRDERHINTSAGNKSSLESSGAMTTDSNKSSKNSFTKDLEKSIELLKKTLQERYDDSEVKNKLIKEIVSRLIKSKYRDDDSGEYLSGLTFSSHKLGLNRGNHTTTSTSDGNMTENNSKKPKKSILRVDKFNSNAVASSSQSAPNLLTAASSNKAIASNLSRPIISNTESDASSQGKTSPKTSSEELYQKYLEALKREQAYKKHLRDKELFLKQKLACSDSALKVPKVSQELRVQNRIKDLMKDLTRNNYDDGSGDASKLEGSSNVSFGRLRETQNQRSHSVFTLSSSQSDCPKKPNLKKKYCDIKDLTEAGPSSHYCCCPHHHTNTKVGYVDSSVQVNIKCQYDEIDSQISNKCTSIPCHANKCKDCPRCRCQPISGNNGGVNYVCACKEKSIKPKGVADNSMLCQYSDLKTTDSASQKSDTAVQCGNSLKLKNDNIQLIRPPYAEMDNESIGSEIPCGKRQSKSSQTNLLLKMMYQELSDSNTCFSDGKTSKDNRPISLQGAQSSLCLGKNYVHEATRSLQTEISINPKITDPSLGDINIVSDCECAKFISEQYREVVQSGSSKTNSSQKSNACMQGNGSTLGKNSWKCVDMFRNQNIDNKDSESTSNKCTTFNKQEFTIPIRGTNMTLMVNLGKVEAIVPKQISVDQGCVTDSANIVEQATCIAEECSKSIQCGSPEFAKNNALLSNPVDVNCNKVTKEVGTINNTQSVNNGSDTAVKCSTYPKNTKPNIHKPLCRSNTDTDRVEKIRFMILDIPKGSFASQTGIYSEESREENYLDVVGESKCEPKDSISPRCECGSKITEDHCCGKKDFGTQKDLSPCSPKRTEKVFSSCSPKRKETECSRSCSPKKAKESHSASTDTDTAKNEQKSSKNLPTSPCRSGNQKQKNGSSNTCNFGVNTDSKMPQQMCSCGSDKSSRSSNEEKSCGNKLTKKKISCKTNNESVNSSNTNNSDDKGDCCNLKQNKCYESGPQKDMNYNEQHTCYSSCKKLNQNICGTEKSQKTCCDRYNSKNEESAPSPRKAEALRGGLDKKNKDAVSTHTEHFQPSSSNESGKNTRVKPTPYGDQPKDPILDMIREITKVYSKEDVEKYKKKKCFKEIMTVLHYLLETDESDRGNANTCATPTNDSQEKIQHCCDDKGPERSINISSSKCKESDAKISIDSSDVQASTDLPLTSSDSAACKVLNKIKKECEKFHQKRCRSGRKCYSSSTTSVNCDQCKKVHYCFCKSHKCRKMKGAEKLQKKCIAYNLIIQTSESVLSEEKPCDTKCRPLQNIVVKVPKSKHVQNICKETTCKKETVYKKEKASPRCGNRSRSCPNESEVSSAEEILKKTQQCTVRQYLEKNRPDFVENCTQRQSCLKFVSDVRANERNAKRNLLSMHVERQPDLTVLSSDELRRLATEIGLDLRRKRPAPKFISEREMKKHSENIYKTLPEVVQKKEEQKKQNIKKTNLLMANIFRKNLQKKTLRGSVNLSNYSSVIKI